MQFKLNMLVCSNSILLHFLFVNSQMDGQPKYQPRTFEVTALQNGNNIKIDLYSNNTENKLQVLN